MSTTVPEYTRKARLVEIQPTVKFRDLNKETSTTGLSSVSSQMMRAIKPTAAIMVSTTISVELNQSSSRP